MDGKRMDRIHSDPELNPEAQNLTIPRKPVYTFCKYGFDLGLALILTLLFFPLALLLAFLIMMDDRKSFIFSQERIGLSERPFRLYKFRSMVINAQNQGDGIYCGENDQRITRIGKFLRKTSLDELPQLWNIIKGEMSFVGPRPTLAYQVSKYSPRQKLRLSLRPGITGWAQINGRNAIPWSQRIQLDLWYSEHRSLGLDIRILWKTLFPGSQPPQVYGDKDIFDL